jgi:hypothetical protein
MADKNQETRPVYAITEKGEEKSYWTKVGVAFAENRDGSINIELDALPCSGRLQIRNREEPREAEERPRSGSTETERKRKR